MIPFKKKTVKKRKTNKQMDPSALSEVFDIVDQVENKGGGILFTQGTFNG